MVNPGLASLITGLILSTVDVILAGKAVGLRFTGHGYNLTVSQGHEAKLNCSLLGMEEPEIQWLKDGVPVQSADQMYIPEDEDHWISFLSLKNVERPDAGKYWCEAEDKGIKAVSDNIWITVEGVPYFTAEPKDMAVLPNTTFTITCAAIGPPEPLTILWLVGGSTTVRKTESSPSVLFMPGIQQNTFFSCEARNSKGVSSSRTAIVHVKGLPQPPSNVNVTKVTSTTAAIAWEPGFDNYSTILYCTVQVLILHDSYDMYLQRVNVPPYNATIEELKPLMNHSIRLQCTNEVGPSAFTDWLSFQTLESVPALAPQNVHVTRTESGLMLEWEEIALGLQNYTVLGYKVQWEQENITQGEVFVQGNQANLTVWDPKKDLIVHVCVANSAGCGPWSDFLLVASTEEPDRQRNPHTRMSWVPLVLGILTALVTVVAMTLIFLRKRRKETRFGHMFGSVLGRGGPAIQFTAARSFNRRGTEVLEATLDSIGISDELKSKLTDVLIQQQQFTLGRTLGKGEFGSVREAQLKMEDGSLQKVAVKMLKTEIFCSSDIEEFLREAAFMKEFDHLNVCKLIGVSLRSRTKGRLPVPMVILPFMKHGDLHTFLLMSRIGEEPITLPIQTLIRFMIDICSGMEYLSSKNFIHRDLATRNCMLHEDMTVCVADFGLSKKIYSGDYYRQGCASKLPVKWLALESLADNVYTAYSDVWAFGITLWEILTLGQTPYAGIENSEIYSYLIAGNRLKQPPDCLDELYEMMCQCWITEPKRRPCFTDIKRRLETILGRLSLLSASQDPLYVNLGETCGATASDSILHSGFDNDDCCIDISQTCGAAAAASSDYRYIVNPGCLRDANEWPPSAQTPEARGLLNEDEDDEEEIQEAHVVINL
ncbi:PREDICTED: tyrosine-protein kinase receptor TYRO3 [Nanorana parkeri]|uniref:tyrosine-protein kinase receptor TYRO3 n=1 Tax=Nanorana parkeri TaxID=125878 RepID=UPI000854E964|nr:PREDICTED: tyrosine-protein kinase receptor TYRO3 [Nanorana parkeri]